MEWLKKKELAWKRILADKEIGYLDPDIFDVLEIIFKRPKSYTKSSCSGRITIIDAEYPWKRKNSSIAYKNHFGITLEDLKNIVDKPTVWRLWILVQSPILHIYTYDLNEALDLLKIARNAGFKHSGILTMNEDGILIEITSGVRLTQLIKDENGNIISDLEKIAKISNEILHKGKEKLEKFKKLLLNSLIINDSMELRKNSKR
jgi:tRNA wybutosine-synthesizing protein 3